MNYLRSQSLRQRNQFLGRSCRDCTTHLPYKQLRSWHSQRQRNSFTLEPLQTLNIHAFLTSQYLLLQERPGYNLALRYDEGLLYRIQQKAQVL